MEKYVIEMPQEVKDIIRQIEQSGFEAYAVGGCVRDCILGYNDIGASGADKSCFQENY